jgi:integrase
MAITLKLKYVTFDAAQGLYLYERRVPLQIAALLERKRIRVSLGKTHADVQRNYTKVHGEWEERITKLLNFTDRVEAIRNGEDDDKLFHDSAVEFLNLQAAKAGGYLPEIDWELNWAARAKLWQDWCEWNRVMNKRPEAQEKWFHDDVVERLDELVVAYKVFVASTRARVDLSAQLPAPLTDSQTKTRDGQIVMSLEELRVKWEAERKRSTASKGDVKNMVKLFTATNGNIPVHEINASHRINFRDAVQRMTGRWGKPPKAQSKNKLMRALQGLGSYAEGINVVTSNPLKFKPFTVTDVTDRESFTDEDLTKLFKSAAWANRSKDYRTFIDWFFRIGAYTGARIGEIAQLRAEDVFEHHGTWVFRLTFEDEEGGRQSKTRRIKIVPVADQLIRWGFLKFVESRKGGQLFPNVKPNAAGNWSAAVSPKVSAVLRKAGFPKEYVAHSWRHTIGTRLRGKAEDSVVKRLTHPPKTGGSVWHRYGDVEIAEMKKAVNKLVYKVEWPKL